MNGKRHFIKEKQLSYNNINRDSNSDSSNGCNCNSTGNIEEYNNNRALEKI